jgi:hypothetical protein
MTEREAADDNYVTQSDTVPEFFNYVRSLHADDLVAELLQNEIDAGSTHTIPEFGGDRLICRGNGAPIDADGWKRLTFLRGAGDEVPQKKGLIGIKNHGLKACFTIGDKIFVRSGGLRTDQTLYKHGEDKPPKPAARKAAILDPAGPAEGCTIEVPYRRRQLVSTMGERVVLDVPTGEKIDALFVDAAATLVRRFIGTLRPDVRPRHLLELRHHRLGTTSFSFTTTRALDRGKFQIFSRTCEISAPDGQRVVRERVITRPILRPPGVQHDVPDFYARKARLVIEVAWAEGTRGRILPTPGELRYPIGYTLAGPETRSGFAVHYSAPFASDTERHGLAGQSGAWNLHLRSGCDALLVDAISWLLDKADVRPLHLLGVEDAPQDRLVPMTVALAEHRALPSIPPRGKGGPAKRRARRRWGRILIPSTKAAPAIHSEALAEAAPAEEWLLAPATPGRLRALLVDGTLDGWCENRVSFDESDVLARLRPIGADENAYFPWHDDTQRWRALSNVPLVRRYLDALLEGAPAPAPNEDVELPDGRGVPVPLAKMSLASDLPTDLPGVSLPPLLHPGLADHPLFRLRDWHRPHFGFPELVDTLMSSPMEAAVARKLFSWLARNPNGFPKRSWPVIMELPIWPDVQGGYGRLGRLCEPKNGALARILGDTIARLHADIAKLRTSVAARRLSLWVRTEPEEHEISAWLADAFARLPIERPLSEEELLRFRNAERDLEVIAKSPSAKKLASLAAPPALARDGALSPRSNLVAPSAAVDRMALLPGHVARNRLDASGRIWPMLAIPDAAMVFQALNADPRNGAALLPRLKALGEATAGFDLGVSQLACIPLGGEFVAPGTLAFKGNRGDCWGAYRRQISGKNLAPADQALYRRAGVFPAEPNPEASRAFFRWLNEDQQRIGPHLPQIIRQFAHDRGPTSWWAIHDGEPCLPVSSAQGVELVSHRTATRGRSVFVPDFRALALAIAQDPGQLMLAIDKHEDVTASIAQVLLQQDVRSLRRVAGDPLRATGPDPRPAPAWVDEIVATLKSSKIARTLEKRLDDLQVSKDHLHAYWPSRLAAITRVDCAARVVATYKVGKRELPAEVDHAFEAETGVLWLRLAPNDRRSTVESALFMAIAERVFEERAPLWCGPALGAALNADIIEAKAVAEEKRQADEAEADGSEGQRARDDDGDADPDEAPTGHYDWTPDPGRNVPNPGELPENDGKPEPDKPSDRDKKTKRDRVEVPGEEAQIKALKEDHYAFHCQISLARNEPAKLAPAGSYVELAENRAKMIDAHHADYAGARGARHAGNLLILSHVEHHRVGRKLSREQVRSALIDARPHRVTFGKGVASRVVEGVVAEVLVPSTGEIVPIFFTQKHRDYWLR